MPRFTPTARDYMSPMPRMVGPTESLNTVRELMQELSVRHLPVMDGDEVVGIISERDLRAKGGGVVEDVMSREVYAVSASTTLNKVARDMAEQKIGSALVMDGKAVAGILTAVDALRALADALEGKHARPLGEAIDRFPTRGVTRPVKRPD